jgi:hypothetical protein
LLESITEVPIVDVLDPKRTKNVIVSRDWST